MGCTLVHLFRIDINMIISPNYDFFFKILFTYSLETHTGWGVGRDTGRGRNRLHAGSPTTWGLHPETPGSCPGLKAGAKLLSHPGIP